LRLKAVSCGRYAEVGNQSGSVGGMAAYRQTFKQAVLRLVAGKRLIGHPIPDVQLGNRKGIGKGR
jgi:hypothetical protein